MTTASIAARRVPACALKLIKTSEGLHDGDKRTPILLEPQPDPVGIYSVGWGYALFQNGKPVKDRETAYRMWRTRWPNGFVVADADRLCEQTGQEITDRILRLLPGHAPTDLELGAMVSLAYNIGVGEPGGLPDFADSSVRRKYLAGDKAGAADAFLLWKYADGRVIDGLLKRRQRERAVFLGAQP